MAEIIERKFWKHKVTGRTASPYGSVPWTSSADEHNWEMITKGFTIKWPDGTVGTGHHGPCETREQADALLQRMGTFKGFRDLTL